MYKHFFIILFMFSLVSLAQDINAFSDFNNRLYQFDKGAFRQIYFQPVRELHLGSDFVAYVDNKGDLIVNYNGKQETMTQTHNQIFTSDNLLLVQTATVLRVFDQGEKKVLTSSAKSFAMNDSIVLWQDQIGNYLTYYYNGISNRVTMVVGDYQINPDYVGANTFVYTDNIGTKHVFWHGKYYEMLSSPMYFSCVAGQDIVAFNDPNSSTFAVFDKGDFFDVEDQQVRHIHAGNGFAYYVDQSGTHKVYYGGNVQELSFSEITNLNVKDSVIVFDDIGIHKIWYNGKVYQIFNTPLKNYQVDGGIIVYRNNSGGVAAFVRGKEIEIEPTQVEEFRLHGNTILLKYGPSAFGVWWNGKIYRF